MKNTLKWAITILAVLFILIQFYRPERTNPPVNPALVYTRSLSVPPDIKSIVDRACRDCHSNETRWPWYSNIAPISWVLIHDVEEGRRHMNFSEWGSYKKNKQINRLSSISSELSDGTMPMPKYVRMHPEANLSTAERDRLSKWADDEGNKLNGGD